METWYYEVVSIDGDYANLKRTDVELDDIKLVARALLPAEIMVGSKLKYELMQYEIMQCKEMEIYMLTYAMNQRDDKSKYYYLYWQMAGI